MEETVKGTGGENQKNLHLWTFSGTVWKPEGDWLSKILVRATS
jgi:hypothetical protein